MANLQYHYEDSLSVLPHLPPTITRLIDLGSGQGFPAIPLAIETDLHVELIEADRRKAAFLTTVLAQLQLPGTVWPTRIEATHLPPATCVTARGLAPLAVLVAAARPFIKSDGCGLFLKGKAVAAELADLHAREAVTASVIRGSSPSSCLVKITGIG